MGYMGESLMLSHFFMLAQAIRRIASLMVMVIVMAHTVALQCADDIRVLSSKEKVAQAQAFLQEQRRLESLCLYLEALEDEAAQLDHGGEQELSQEEKECLKTLFPLYVDMLSGSFSDQPYEKLSEAIRTYGPKGEVSQRLMKLIMAANQGKMESLYASFYNAYVEDPRVRAHPLSYKIRAVLAMRAFESAYEQNVRETYRQKALHDIVQAFVRFPVDSTLIQKSLFLVDHGSDIKEKQRVILAMKESLISSEDPPCRREDFFLLIRALIDIHDPESAKQLIQKGRTWYHYSRTLNQYEIELSE